MSNCESKCIKKTGASNSHTGLTQQQTVRCLSTTLQSADVCVFAYGVVYVQLLSGRLLVIVIVSSVASVIEIINR